MVRAWSITIFSISAAGTRPTSAGRQEAMSSACLERSSSRLRFFDYECFWLRAGSRLSRNSLACRKSAVSKPSVNWA